MPDEQREPAQKGLDAAIQKVRLEQAGEEVPEALAAGVAQADEAMFSHLRTMLGLDKVVSVNVGAAPTPVEVLEFFHAIGIPIGELWGMSETCGAATVNPPGKVKIGCVGPPMAGFEIKLAEDGEVFVRGAANMVGYRNLPDKTAETIDDEGWLATGDIGELDEDGYLKIVDRKKELIINAAGKNMSPANIEAKIKTSSPLIGQAVAIGDARPYNVALITLDPDFAPGWAQKRGYRQPPSMRSPADEQAVAAVEEGDRAANEQTGTRRADQEVQAARDRLAARRGRADADDEAQAQADPRQVRGGDRRRSTAVSRRRASRRPRPAPPLAFAEMRRGAAFAAMVAASICALTAPAAAAPPCPLQPQARTLADLDSTLESIIAGPDGRLYFTDAGRDRLMVLDRPGPSREFWWRGSTSPGGLTFIDRRLFAG